MLLDVELSCCFFSIPIQDQRQRNGTAWVQVNRYNDWVYFSIGLSAYCMLLFQPLLRWWLDVTVKLHLLKYWSIRSSRLLEIQHG